MSPLTWNLTAIPNHEKICWREDPDAKDEDKRYRLDPVTETLIFATMSVGIGRITEKNAGEFYARCKILEHIDGAYMYTIESGERIDRFLTPDMVRAHIGLVCNVADLTRAGFYKMLGNHLNTFKRDYDRAAKAAKGAV